MGASHPKRNLTMPFNIQDYRQVPSKGRSENPYQQRYRVLRNIHTEFEMQEYQVHFENQTEFQNYYEAFEWRLSQPNIVNTTYFSESLRREFCSTIYAGTLYTERIPLKLSEIKDIPYPDNLYILMSALDGFSLVYSKIGFFIVQEYMICINNQGKAKVWINDDLSKNYPDPCDMDDEGSEQDMVRRTVELLDENTDSSTRPVSVREYFDRHYRNPRFIEAKKLIRQLAKQYKTDIPQSFDCIKDILNPEFDSQDLNESEMNDRLSANHSTRVAKRLTYPTIDQLNQHRRSVRQSQDQEIRQSRLTVQSRSHIQDKNQLERRFFSFNSNIRQATSPVMLRPPQMMINQGQSQPMMRKPIIQHVHQPFIREMPVQRYQSPVLGHPNGQLIRSMDNPQYNGSSRIGYAPGRIVTGMHYMNSSQIQPHRVVAPMQPANIKMYKSDDDRYFKNQTYVQPNQKERIKEKEVKKRYKSKRKYNEESEFSESSIYSDKHSFDYGKKKGKRSIISTDNDRRDRYKKKQSRKQNYSKGKERSKIKNQRIYEDEEDSQNSQQNNKRSKKAKKYEKHHNLSNLMEYIDQEENPSRYPEQYRIQIISEDQLNDKKFLDQPFQNQISNVQFRQAQKPRNRPAINVFGSDIPKRQFRQETQRAKQELERVQKNMQTAIQKTRQVISNGSMRNSPRVGSHSVHNMGAQAKQYYSAKFDHDLDPEIAYDLLGLGLS